MKCEVLFSVKLITIKCMTKTRTSICQWAQRNQLYLEDLTD